MNIEMSEKRSLPRHVAIIMDGNGRWAKRRMLPRVGGHRAGIKSVQRVVRSCGKKGIEALTLFAFSSENWRRPAKEVGFLMDMFLQVLKNEIHNLNRNNVCLKVIGAREGLPADLCKMIGEAENITSKNTGLKLLIAANYGGRWDIVQSARKIATRINAGDISPEDVTEEFFSSQMSFGDYPPPDLFIRTGGDCRISNFMLWDLAYTELYFTDILWPDFDEEALQGAFDSYTSRERRFGRTGEQALHA